MFDFFSRHHPFLPIVRTVLRCFFCVFHFLFLLRRKCILEKMWLEMGSTSLTTKLKKDIKICYTHWGKYYFFVYKLRIFEFSRQKGWFDCTDLSQNLILLPEKFKYFLFLTWVQTFNFWYFWTKLRYFALCVHRGQLNKTLKSRRGYWFMAFYNN